MIVLPLINIVGIKLERAIFSVVSRPRGVGAGVAPFEARVKPSCMMRGSRVHIGRI